MELAACGLDCDACNLKPDQCDGCHAITDNCWSPDCKIRKCCLFKKKLANCSECVDFPCNSVIELEADKWEHHSTAAKRLRVICNHTNNR